MCASGWRALSVVRSSVEMWIRRKGICEYCAEGPPLAPFIQSWRVRPCYTCQSKTKNRLGGFLMPLGIDSHQPREQRQHREGQRCRRADREGEDRSGIENRGCNQWAKDDQRKSRDPRPKQHECTERHKNAR